LKSAENKDQKYKGKAHMKSL